MLYTGDYSMEADRHLMAAEMPSTSPDVLIVEATYGVQVITLPCFCRNIFSDFCFRRVRSGHECLMFVIFSQHTVGPLHFYFGRLKRHVRI